MRRYEAIVGQIVINGKTYPILACEVLVDGLDVAYEILEIMGYVREDISFKEPYFKVPKYLEHQLN